MINSPGNQKIKLKTQRIADCGSWNLWEIITTKTSKVTWVIQSELEDILKFSSLRFCGWCRNTHNTRNILSNENLFNWPLTWQRRRLSLISKAFLRKVLLLSFLYFHRKTSYAKMKMSQLASPIRFLLHYVTNSITTITYSCEENTLKMFLSFRFRLSACDANTMWYTNYSINIG